MASDNEPEISCPHCGEAFDGFTVYEHNAASSNPRCPACSEPVADDEWVQD